MREIRMALLEADVNYRVVRGFVSACKEKCMTADVLDSLTPAQNVVRIVLDQLTQLLGSTEATLQLAQNRTPNVIMLVGLQGSGKTTAAAKLAYMLKKQKHSPLLAACDTHRPAAADQLATLGGEIGVPVYRGDGKDAVKVAAESIDEAIAHDNYFIRLLAVLDARLGKRRIKALAGNIGNEPEWFRKWILLRAGTKSQKSNEAK